MRLSFFTLLHHQVYDEGYGHADAADANEALDELVTLLALRETAEVAAKPGSCRHDNSDWPVDFTCHAECDRAYKQKYVGERVLEGVHVNRVKPGVSREPENLYEPDADLHDATVNGDAEESESPFKRELFGWGCGRLAENVLTQVAHDDHKADDDGENGLEEFVPNANQEACADEGSEKCRQEQLQKDFFV